MFAIIVRAEKTELEDKISYSLVNGGDLPKVLKDADISFSEGHISGELFFFDSKEEAEKNMGL